MGAAEKLKSYLNGDRLHVRYTFLSDDITQGEAPFGMPYRDRKGYFDKAGYCKRMAQRNFYFRVRRRDKGSFNYEVGRIVGVRVVVSFQFYGKEKRCRV